MSRTKTNLFQKAHKEMQTDIDQFIERILNDKDIHKNHFSDWKSHVMLLVKAKIRTLKNKTTCESVKSIFSEHEVKDSMFSLQ